MNAQQMLLDYAKAKNNTNMTDQQFIGKAITEGIRIANTASGDIVIARIARQGKTITVTETTKTETINGKSETTVEIFQVNV